MGLNETTETEQRDYQWLFDRLRTIIGDVVDPLKDDIRETKALAKETRDKLNGKTEIVIRNEERIKTLEGKNIDEKKDTKSHWTIGLSIVSVIIALGTFGIGLFLFIQRGLNG